MLKRNYLNNKKEICIIPIFFIIVICFMFCFMPNVKAAYNDWEWESDAVITPATVINGNNITCSIANRSGGSSLFQDGNVSSLQIKMTLYRLPASGAPVSSAYSKKTVTHTYDGEGTYAYAFYTGEEEATADFLTFSFQTNKNYVGTNYYTCQYEWTGYIKYYGSYQDMSGHTEGGTEREIAVNNGRIVFDASYNGGTISSDGANTKVLYVKYQDVQGAPLYTTLQGDTTASMPFATKPGYSFLGWYNAGSGGAQVVNSSGSLVQQTVSGWTTYMGYYYTWDIRETNKRLYAQYDGMKYSVYLNDGYGNTSSSPAFYYKTGYSTQIGSDSSRRCYYWTNSNLTTCVNSPTSPLYYVTTAPTKTNYTFQGYYTGQKGTGTRYILSSGLANTSSPYLHEYTNNNNSNVTLYANWTIDNPNTPTISGVTTRYYNTSGTTLTCGETKTYSSSDIHLEYSFGYATSDGGTPSNWSNWATANTYVIPQNEAVGQKYYSCRVRAVDTGGFTSDTMTSSASADALVTTNYPSITFNNGGTTAGTLYAKYGTTSLYTGPRNATAGTIPTVSKTGYTFAGWYTAATGGTKVINADKSVVASVSNWTNASKQWQLMANSTLNAQYTPNTYTIGYTLNGGSYGTNHPTSGTYDSSVLINNPTKTVTVTGNANSTGATIGSATSKAQTFSGWTSTTVGDNAKTGTTNNPTTAWTGTSTKNTYFKNLRESGTVTMVANWTPVAFNLPTVTKDGYACKWNTKADGTGTSYNSGASYTPTATSAAAVTLYAQCTANTYTIGYTLNGGSYGTNHPTSGTYDSAVLINNPTKTVTVTGNANSTGATVGSATSKAQTFSGWTSTTVGSNAKTGTTNNPTTAWTGTSTKNTYFKNLRESGTVTMVANWTPVAFNLPTVTKTGHTCAWYDASGTTGGNKVGDSGDSYTPLANDAAAKTVYARCEANEITVTKPDNTTETKHYGDSYDLGTNESTKASEELGTVTFKYQDGETSDTTGTVVKSYTPDGWLVNDVQKDDDEILTLTEDITIRYNYSETKTSPEFPVPTKEHYEFDGWYDEETDGNKVTTYTGDEDITLYGHWVGEEITVTYPDETEETYHYGDSFTFGVNNVTKQDETSTVTFKYQDDETDDTTGTVTKSFTPNGWKVGSTEYSDNEIITLTEDITIEYNYTDSVTGVTLPEPTRNHYTFEGWYDSEGNEITSYTELEDITLYAHWSGEEITVTKPDDTTETKHYGDSYDLGTNNVAKSNETGGIVTFKYGDDETDDTTGTVVKSYTPDGWLVNGVEKDDNEVLTLTEDITIRYNYSETKTSPEFPTPTRDHYTFDGWYDEATDGNKVTEYTGDEDITLYANWIGDEIIVTKPDDTTETKHYGDSYDLGTNDVAKSNENGGIVTFKYQDDETSDTTGTVIKSYTPDGWLVNDVQKDDDEVLTLTEDITIRYNYSETKTSPEFPTPTREHYTFDGWYDEETDGNKVTTYTGDEDMTLYGHWIGDPITVTYPDETEETYHYGDPFTFGVNTTPKQDETATVTFKYQDDETDDTTGTVTKSFTPNGWKVGSTEYSDNEVLTLTEDITIEYNYTDSVTGVTLPAPTRDHYTFEGWYDSEGNEITSYTELEDITLYAHWSGEEIIVTKPDDTTETKHYGDSYDLGINNVAKANGNGAEITFKYQDNETSDTTANVIKSYTPDGWLVNGVEKDDNEVLTLTEDITIRYNYSETKTSPEFPTPTRDNYTFDGWYDEETDGNKVTEYTGDEDTTLYAHWSLDKPTDFTVDSNVLILVKDETHQIVPTFIPEGTTDTLNYEDYDNEIISVSDEGLITALKPGTTEITVSLDSDSSVTETISVTVINNKFTSTSLDVETKDLARIIIGEEPGTTIQNFLPKLDNPTEYLKLYTKDGDLVEDTSEVIRTGMKVKLVINDQELDEAFVVVRGDLNEDGKVDVKDGVALQNHIMHVDGWRLNDYRVYAGDIIEKEGATMENMLDVTDGNYIDLFILKDESVPSLNHLDNNGGGN